MAINMPNKLAIGSSVTFYVLALLYLVGFSVSYWHTDGSEHFGLWKVCFGNECYTWSNLLDYVKATQAMMCLALIMFIGSGIAHVICLCNLSPQLTRIAAQIAAAGTFVGGLLGIIGVIVFGAEYGRRVTSPNGYGFWMCALCSGFMALLGAVSLYWTFNSSPDDTPMTMGQSQMAAPSLVYQQHPQTVYVQQQVGQPQQQQQHFVVGQQTTVPQCTVVVPSDASQMPLY